MTQGQEWPHPQLPTQAAPQQKKKSYKGWILGGCGGCLTIFFMLCVCSGWLLYLEEGVPYSDPGDELTSVPIAASGPVSVETMWDGTGYADLRVYVDLGESAPRGTVVSGRFGCDEHGSMEMRDFHESHYGGPEGWVQIPPPYMYRRASSAPIRCAGTITLPPEVPSARLVVTAKQRPSDWLSEWF